MARRTFLHVGTPKSATTYLQYVLWKSARRPMKQHGMLLPGARTTHFLAAKGVTGRVDQQQKSDMDPAEAWPRLAEQINTWRGDALVCHELFAPATSRQASRAKAALEDTEVHLVLTARSLARQVPAAWQQQVKGGVGVRYDRYIERLLEGDPVRHRMRGVQGRADWFWHTQDLTDIAERWGADIPPERVHIVTLPTDSSDPALLWRRYASVFGLEDAQIDSTAPLRNVSLGRVETELLRRLNNARDRRLRGPGLRRWTRGLLGANILTERAGSPIGLPEECQGWVGAFTDKMLHSLEDSGYDVVGDLDDLRAGAPVTPWHNRQVATPEEVAELVSWTIGQLAEHLERVRQDSDDPSSVATPDGVGPDDGIPGIIELIEHIRAASTGQRPRPKPRQPRRLRPRPLRNR
jgi:hypothetical protein